MLDKIEDTTGLSYSQKQLILAYWSVQEDGKWWEDTNGVPLDYDALLAKTIVELNAMSRFDFLALMDTTLLKPKEPMQLKYQVTLKDKTDEA